MARWELWHPDAVLEELAEVPDAAVYHGIEEIARYIVKLADAFEEIRWEPKEFVDLGDDVERLSKPPGCGSSRDHAGRG